MSYSTFTESYPQTRTYRFSFGITFDVCQMYHIDASQQCYVLNGLTHVYNSIAIAMTCSGIVEGEY